MNTISTPKKDKSLTPEFNPRFFDGILRNTVGFDTLVKMLDQTSLDSATYPPYNIEQLSENTYRVSIAVAGFSENDIDVTLHDGLLTVEGTKKEEKKTYLYKGIANRSFKREFTLANFIKVVGAEMDSGILHITLDREIPDEMKPRKIEIAKRNE